MLLIFAVYNQNFNDMEEYKYLLVYDDYVDIEGMDEEEAEEHMTDLAYSCAFNAIETLEQYSNDLDNTVPFTRERMLSDEFKKGLERMRVLVDKPFDNGIFILVDKEFNWIDRDFSVMIDEVCQLGYYTGMGDKEQIVDFDD